MSTPDIPELSVKRFEDLEIQVIHIGNCKNRVLKIANFLQSPDSIREYSETCQYLDHPKKRGPVPGMVHKYEGGQDQCCDLLKQIVKKCFGPYPSVQDKESSLFTLQKYFTDSIVREGTLYPHVDNFAFGGICCLNTPEELEHFRSGTSFFRYKETAEEFVNLYGGYRMMNKNMHKGNDNPVSVSSDELALKDWERYITLPHEFNTLYLYEAKLFHSMFFVPNNTERNARRSRLTFNCFLFMD